MLEGRISNSIVGCPRRLVMTKLFATREVSGNIGTRLGSVGSTCAKATPDTPPSEQQRTNAMAFIAARILMVTPSSRLKNELSGPTPGRLSRAKGDLKDGCYRSPHRGLHNLMVTSSDDEATLSSGNQSVWYT